MSWFQKKTSVPEKAQEERPVLSPGESTENNRVLCHQYLDNILQNPLSKGVVLKLYIENFKRLNDVFGYDYCEKLLEQIIAFLREKAGCTVYRYIGVEFIIILENLTQGQAARLSGEILDQFNHVWKVGHTDCLCSVQIGMCSYPGYASTADELLKCLDQAVLKASEYGSNQAVMYDSVLHNRFLKRRKIALYLQTALEKEEIDVRYRPTYNTEQQKFTRAEFHMQIFIKDLGMIGAGEYLPIAEDSGQVREVQYYALNQAGACIAQLLGAGKEFDSISLPISPILFLQEDFLDEVRRVIERYQIPPGKLALEIKESAMTTAYLSINIMMQELSELGVELILNEFGSGYSGITTVLDLPLNTLKMERLFVWQLETNEKAEHIIRGLISIARDSGLSVISEGVETDHQVEVLTDAGCTLMQGFYYSPMVEQAALQTIIGASLEEARQILAAENENTGS